ncbi:MAG: STAS domain-containing protein [Bacteroidota bacterium]
MEFIKEIENNRLHLQFEGDLIGENNGPQLVEVVNEALETGIKNCLLDISKVRYINSSGIGVLITLLTKLRNNEGELFLINPSEHVSKLLIMTKLQAIFTIAGSKAEALEKIK